MERPDFFKLKNGNKVKLPFSNNEYNQRVLKLRKVMEKNNLDMIILTSMHNIAYYTGFIYCSLADLMDVSSHIIKFLQFQLI